MSVPNQEFFHFSSWGSGFDPTWYNHYDPIWLAGASKPEKGNSSAESNKDKEEVIELKVNLCCEGCVDKVYRKVKAMEGVATVYCDVNKQKVTVTGPAKPNSILKQVKKISHLQGSTFWKKK